MSITRKLPGTNITRQLALNKAKGKNDSVPLGTTALTPATITRLNLLVPVYNTALQKSAVAKATLNEHTPLKDAAIEDCRMYVSHFIQVFNLGVARSKYPAGARSFYQLDTGSDAVPNLDSEDDALLWAHRLVMGDADRITDGGAPMANPDITEVQAKLAAAETLLAEQSNLEDELNGKQGDVDTQNTQADSLIKRVWDEVETFFGEDDAPSKRANARQWGVVYVTEGAPATLTGLVKTGAGAAVEGAVVTVDQTGATATTNHEGRYTITTTVLGDVTVHATLATASGTQPVTIPDHTDGINVSVPDIVLA